jgi:hypothetical protein
MPFLEAFFHARHFLEMAVPSARELHDPPIQLPTAWATLLYLYQMHQSGDISPSLILPSSSLLILPSGVADPDSAKSAREDGARSRSVEQ